MQPQRPNSTGDVVFSASPRSGHLVHALRLQGRTSPYLGLKRFTTGQAQANITGASVSRPYHVWQLT